MKRKYLIVTLILFNINVIVSAQKDTLQNFPFIYCYNCPETGVIHDSILCTVRNDDNGGVDRWIMLEDSSYTFNLFQEFAVSQTSENALRAVGIAFGYVEAYSTPVGYTGNDVTIVLSIYETSMKALKEITTEPYTIYWPTWYEDSAYQILTLPGKINPISWFDTTDIVLKYAFFDEPIEVIGDFYIGLRPLRNNQYEESPYIPWIYETHNPPYHFENSTLRLLKHGKWYEGTTKNLPVLFLIIEPECHSAENFRVATDSAGCVTVEWDTLKYQRQWVLRLVGPGGTRYDTVETNSFTYFNLDTNAHYELCIQTQCYLPGGRHNLSSWSNPVTIGHGVAAIEDFSIFNSQFSIHPNPASRQVEISATLPMTHIEATDILGHRLFDRPASGLTSTLDVSSWPAGTYLLRITTPSGVATKKLLVK